MVTRKEDMDHYFVEVPPTTPVIVTMTMAPHKLSLINLAIKTFQSKGIGWVSSNDGIHMQLTTMVGIVDFWPTTGKFRVRSTGLNGVGLKSLLEEIL